MLWLVFKRAECVLVCVLLFGVCLGEVARDGLLLCSIREVGALRDADGVDGGVSWCCSGGDFLLFGWRHDCCYGVTGCPDWSSGCFLCCVVEQRTFAGLSDELAFRAGGARLHWQLPGRSGERRAERQARSLGGAELLLSTSMQRFDSSRFHIYVPSLCCLTSTPTMRPLLRLILTENKTSLIFRAMSLSRGQVLPGARWDYSIIEPLKGDGTHISAAFKAKIVPKHHDFDVPQGSALLY